MKPIDAREVALHALSFVLNERSDAPEALSKLAAFDALESRDRAFARLLVMTVLRRLGQSNALLSAFLARPLPEKLAKVQHALQLGAAQLLWLDTPPHAAVNQTVELVKQTGFGGHAGLVNAVLKRIAKEGKAAIAKQDEARLNTAPWLWERWVKQWGEEVTRAIAASHLVEPALDISVKNNEASWAEKLGGVLLPTGSIRCKNTSRIEELPGYSEGEWWVQDAAATLPVTLLGDVRDKKIFDICAAPGGKTAQLAAAGAAVTSVDISAQRITLLQDNMKRLQLSVNAVIADFLTWQPTVTPDAILLDAPCSATGTLRRHPEGMWRKTPDEVARLAILQRKLLARALEILPAGGTLVYCVCSLQQEEGEEQITSLLAARSDVALVAMDANETGIAPEWITPEGTLRTLPCYLNEQGGMDGFFAARLKKI